MGAWIPTKTTPPHLFFTSIFRAMAANPTHPQQQRFLVFLSLLPLLSGCRGVSGRHNPDGDTNPQKLFVFGDSYVDTGNVNKSTAHSWNHPYGITFPGKPAGRFSDGRVLTDYLAMAMGIKSPVAYRWRKRGNGGGMKTFGMNFAYGGTGVFDTLVTEPNMTTQIDFFEQLVRSSFFTPSDLNSSVALVTLAGNDYGAFIARKNSSSFMELMLFIPKVVRRLKSNIRRLREVGVRRVAVTTLQPLGCLPRSTGATFFKGCNDVENMGVGAHNKLLMESVEMMKGEGGGVVLLDLYGAFMAALEAEMMPLRPCCMGVTKEWGCGSVDLDGGRMYQVCDDPGRFFFWDSVHPTQAGWEAVSSHLCQDFKALAVHVTN